MEHGTQAVGVFVPKLVKQVTWNVGLGEAGFPPSQAF